MLDLKWCNSLVGLPNNFGRSVPKLNRLEMSWCGNLKALPNSIGLLTELEHLDLSNCHNLTTLPNSIGGLVRLKTMNLSDCSPWENLEIPMELGRLINLEELYVPWCGDKSVCLLNGGELEKLKKLEMKGYLHGLERLKGVTHLCVRYCEEVSMLLSNSLGAFTALQSLHMEHVDMLSHIPQSLEKLKCLLRVEIRYCTELSCIDALPQCLEHLDLEGCCSLIEVPSLKPMKSLVHLNLKDCQQLRHIHGLKCLTTLVFINLVNCASLKDDGVSVNKDNKALVECDLRNSKVGVAYNNAWLEVRLLIPYVLFGCFLLILNS